MLVFKLSSTVERGGSDGVTTSGFEGDDAAPVFVLGSGLRSVVEGMTGLAGEVDAVETFDPATTGAASSALRCDLIDAALNT